MKLVIDNYCSIKHTLFFFFITNILILSTPLVNQTSFLSEATTKIDKIYQNVIRPITYSKIGRKNFDEFLNYTKLTLNVVEFTGVLSKNDIEPYEWNSCAESDSNQRELIMQYFNQHLKPSLPTNIIIYDVVNNKNLLDITAKNSPFPFKIRGGTDFILAEQGYIDTLILRAGIHAIIELKKVIQRQHVWQAISEMIAADFLANNDIKTIGVLTDLNEAWHLFWLGEGGEIMMTKFSNREKALEIISKMVKIMDVAGLPGLQRTKICNNNVLHDHTNVVNNY
jgi:hypothetical protein